eukprot:NODE_5058_length_615_cov_515.807143.p1 GENE.NODE_5058_length_615_cov_515.807143~~NODE_5058_length_615_cov_515.807143.p1  ORF type:complete len:114 (-),score=13.68 NODE_5058_length_615_cov_515.807143:157-498(-)
MSQSQPQSGIESSPSEPAYVVPSLTPLPRQSVALGPLQDEANQMTQAVQQAQVLSSTVKHLCGQVAELEHSVLQLTAWKDGANQKLTVLRQLHRELAEASSAIPPSEGPLSQP